MPSAVSALAERGYGSGSSAAGDADDEESLRGVSPAPTESSVYSYASSENGHMILREVCGRIINSTSEYYMLPGKRLHSYHFFSLADLD